MKIEDIINIQDDEEQRRIKEIWFNDYNKINEEFIKNDIINDFKHDLKLLEKEYFKNFDITKKSIAYKTKKRNSINEFTDDEDFIEILKESLFFIKINNNYYTSINAFLFLKQNLKSKKSSYLLTTNYNKEEIINKFLIEILPKNKNN